MNGLTGLHKWPAEIAWDAMEELDSGFTIA
jgi:hypothetical protein